MGWEFEGKALKWDYVLKLHFLRVSKSDLTYWSLLKVKTGVLFAYSLTEKRDASP